MRLDNSPSNWRELYIAAVLEIDKGQILRRIHTAKIAICDRVEELDGGGKAAERVALNQAMKVLSKLQAVYRCESQMAVGGAILRHDNLRRPWQVVAQELTVETNPERVVELSHELIQVLDQQKIDAKWQDHDGDGTQPTTNNTRGSYEEIIDDAVTLMGSDYASLQMLFPERGSGGELRLLAFRGFNPEAAKFWEWVRADSKCTCGIALRDKRRVVAPDVADCDFMANSEDLQTYLQAGIRAVQTTPLISRGGNLIGMISTHWRTPHQPSEKDFRLFDTLARQAADLIEYRGDGEFPPSERPTLC